GGRKRAGARRAEIPGLPDQAVDVVGYLIVVDDRVDRLRERHRGVARQFVRPRAEPRATKQMFNLSVRSHRLTRPPPVTDVREILALFSETFAEKTHGKAGCPGQNPPPDLPVAASADRQIEHQPPHPGITMRASNDSRNSAPIGKKKSLYP